MRARGLAQRAPSAQDRRGTRPLAAAHFETIELGGNDVKLVRYGAFGQEKPGLIDAAGKLRDLSAHVPDIAGAALKSASLGKLKGIAPESLPLVEGEPRIGACVGDVRNPQGADPVQQGAELYRRPE
jgi:hypothetical protein